MLDKDLFFEQLERLYVLFPNWKIDISDERVTKTWYEELNDLSDEEFKEMVDEYIQSKEFPPTIGGLRNCEVEEDKFSNYEVVN